MQKVELETHRDLNIPGLLRRRVDVWLPEEYHDNYAQHFPVLYIQDGQMVFDQFHSRGGGWKVHQAISELAKAEKITAPIVVAIPSTINRKFEYLPAGALNYPGGRAAFEVTAKSEISTSHQQMSDQYIQWIVDTVKPAIDKRYRTLPEVENTTLMGSSLGGLISLYLLCEFPQVFGKAACLSTHWPILGEGMIAYLDEKLPEPGNHKFYFDYGSEGLDRDYAPWQMKVDSLLREKGYREGKDFASWSFPGEDHTTKAWASRVHIPLTFMFGTIDL
jgi:predicted alpha/beta superfamily hydrolase